MQNLKRPVGQIKKPDDLIPLVRKHLFVQAIFIKGKMYNANLLQCVYCRFI